MIGKISGRLDYRGSDHVLIDVGGVGYVVYVSERTLFALPQPPEAVSLYTDLMVREDLLQLFGFTSLIEKEWYRLLLSVQGVGAKASMAILGTIGPEGVSRALAIGDWGAIKAAPGVGPKLAQRVVNELKDKAPTVMAMGDLARSSAGSTDVLIDTDPSPARETVAPRAEGSNVAAQAEALSALSNLGYAPSEAARAVAEAADASSDLSTASLIREALKLLAPKG